MSVNLHSSICQSAFVTSPILRYSGNFHGAMKGVRAEEHLALPECLHVRERMRA